MTGHAHHSKLMHEIETLLKPIFDYSEQAVYLYLDDEHKICNNKFSSSLGYSSPEEWANFKESFPVAFVSEESQENLVKAYQETIENLTGSAIKVKWKNKTGETVDSDVILVPFPYENHVFALHFVSIK